MDSVMAPWLTPSRFPDSDISGSTLVSRSPKLFAAVHVLHRLSTPRHPPRALHSLTVSLRHDSSFRGQGWYQELSALRQSSRPSPDLRSYLIRRLLLIQLSKTRAEVGDLVLEHQLRFGARIHEPDTDGPIIRADGMGSTALESTAFERLLDGRRCRSSRAGNGDLVELTWWS